MKYWLSISILSVALLPLPVQAKTAVYFDSGLSGTIDIKATISEPINAVEGSVFYDDKSVVIDDIETADSVVRLWMVRPSAESGVIRFAGVMPGGISPSLNANIELFRVHAHSLSTGKQEFKLGDFVVYLNQPQPQKDEVALENELVDLPLAAPTVSSSHTISSSDIDLQVVSDKRLNDGARTLIFQINNRSDEEIFIRERFLGLPATWRPAINPEKLNDQSGFSVIDLRGRDGASIKSLIPLRVWVTWVFLSFVVLGVGVYLYRRYKS